VVHAARRGPGRPPAAKAADTRKRIVIAARDVFSERGYDATTFQEIALRADLTRPAINHYFPNKQVLYREVLKQTSELIVKTTIARAKHETTLVDRVSALLAAAIEIKAGNSSATTFFINSVLETQRHPELNHAEVDFIRPMRRFLAGSVAAGIKRGELAADTDAGSLTELLLAMLYGLVLYAGFADSAHTMAAINDQLRRLLAGTL
jgi:AcrR family transcriptional regulator